MTSYLLEVSYTSAAMAAMLKNPHSRLPVIAKVAENLGGEVHAYWFALGTYDAIGIVEMPDHVAVAAFVAAIGAGGACSKIKTTTLLTVEEGLSAFSKAAKAGYTPLGS